MSYVSGGLYLLFSYLFVSEILFLTPTLLLWYPLVSLPDKSFQSRCLLISNSDLCLPLSLLLIGRGQRALRLFQSRLSLFESLARHFELAFQRVDFDSAPQNSLLFTNFGQLVNDGHVRSSRYFDHLLLYVCHRLSIDLFIQQFLMID